MRSDALLRPVLGALARLPLSWLFGLSNVLALLMHRVIRYRASVIEANLTMAFPESSAQDRRQWAKAFYRHFADLIVEMIQSLAVKEAEVRQRLVLENPEIFEALHRQKKPVIVVWGHYTNFEFMAMGLPLLIPQKTFAVYQALRDPGMGSLIVDIRQRFGLVLYEMAETYPFMLGNPEPGPAYIFMADQSPAANKIKFWGRFFNRPTATHLGVENLSKKINAAVVWIDAKKVQRGHYRLRATLLAEHPDQWPDHTLTQAHLDRLEHEIRAYPPHWLWSHKRWKHVLPE